MSGNTSNDKCLIYENIIYILILSINAQYQYQSAGIECRGKNTITYRFISLSEEIIWAKTYESGFSSNDLGGMARIVYSREGAVRENMKAFVRGLRESWPQSRCENNGEKDV